jgi:hypothetical protein
MTQTANAMDGETVDEICHRVLGKTAAVTEQVLDLNPALPNSACACRVAPGHPARRQRRPDRHHRYRAALGLKRDGKSGTGLPSIKGLRPCSKSTSCAPP